MATAGIQGLIDLYTMQADHLTGEISGVSIEMIQATKQATTLANETSDKKQAVKMSYEGDDGEVDEAYMDDYNEEISEIQDDYELKLEVINTWETELQNKQNSLQSQLQEINSYKSAYQSALKQNIGVDFKFGDSSSS